MQRQRYKELSIRLEWLKKARLAGIEVEDLIEEVKKEGKKLYKGQRWSVWIKTRSVRDLLFKKNMWK